jgi:sugar (pentulose or hexulose) kinase
MADTWDVLGPVRESIRERTGLPEDCVVNMGVHDSNAALVPYFAQGVRDFVVHDSGTWFVTMAPTDTAEFEEEELGKDVFYNRSIYGTPVKTNIFHGGAEFEFFRDHVLHGHPHPEQMDLEVVREIIAGRHAFSLPTISLGSGLFPDSVSCLRGLDVMYKDNTHAWHTVDIGLAMQGYLAITMAGGQNVKKVFIEGNLGRHNPVDRSVISSMLPDAEVYYGTVGGAPFGTALLGVATAEGVRPEALGDRFEMDIHLVPELDVDLGDLKAYLDAFIELAKE